jgi:NhaA family Na+:H+ antiporter
MADDDDVLDPLPEGPVDRLLKPLAQFLAIEAASGLVLLVATVAALILANSPWADSYFGFWRTPIAIRVGGFAFSDTLKTAINDGLMTLFFFVVGLEIKRELVLGELRDRHVAALPIAAALGGMAVPALFFLALQAGEPGEPGWGVVMATDIAFVVGCLAILGTRVSNGLRVFVLSLAIIDDIGAVLVIAFVYTTDLHWDALGAAALCIGVVVLLRHLGVRSVVPFWFVGIAAWLAVHESGVHPTIAGVLLGLLTPACPLLGAGRFQAITGRLGQFLSHADKEEETTALRSVGVAARETLSPLERLETGLHSWVSFVVLPLFALANAGVALDAKAFEDMVTIATVVGLVAGKPVGICAASALAIATGLAARPHGVSWPALAGASVLCGIGFTMALFIANLAFGAELHAAASVGVLAASLLSAVLGLGALMLVLRKS